MEKWINRLRFHEDRLLIWLNRRFNHTFAYRFLHRWLSLITHMGGATFTICCSLLIAFIGRNEISTVGWKCLAALAISHLPVALLKNKFKRLRPYQSLPNVNIGIKPLADPSFPSGHTTAIFALVTPLLLNASLFPIFVVPLLIVVAISVGWSRMYLGLHYPSDVLAGGSIGIITSLAIQYFWHTPTGS